MYDVEKCSTVLKNAAGFMKTRHVYIQSCNKMVALGYVLYIGETKFVFRPVREVQILLRVLVYDWDL